MPTYTEHFLIASFIYLYVELCRFQNLLIDLEPEVFENLDHLETMDLSSNFLMGLNLQFFVEIERKKRLRMVYLQVCNKVTGVWCRL